MPRPEATSLSDALICPKPLAPCSPAFSASVANLFKERRASSRASGLTPPAALSIADFRVPERKPLSSFEKSATISINAEPTLPNASAILFLLLVHMVQRLGERGEIRFVLFHGFRVDGLSFVRELAIKPVEFAGEGFTDQCRDGV